MKPDILKKIANEAFDNAAKKLELKEKIDTQLHVVYNGGLFKATPELITFLHVCSDMEMIIPDVYENPIKINREELKDKLISAYQFAMNSWYTEYQELEQIRSGKNV